MPLKRNFKRFLRQQRGSVAVEFALISSLFLLPLMLGSADIVEIISAQAQVNTSLQSLYLFAYTNPANAGDATSLNAIKTALNTGSIHQIGFGANNGTLTYDCISTAGVQTASTAAATCPNGQSKQEFAAYTVTSSVSLTFPLFTNPFPLSATGTVEVQ
jgi:Flp pilus assembly protein TadG